MGGKRIVLALLLLLAGLVQASEVTKIDAKVVTKLQPLETRKGIIYQDGLIFVSSSSAEDHFTSSIQIFQSDTASKLVTVLPIKMKIEQLIALGKDRIAAIGFVDDPWEGVYAVITRKNRTFSIKYYHLGSDFPALYADVKDEVLYYSVAAGAAVAEVKVGTTKVKVYSKHFAFPVNLFYEAGSLFVMQKPISLGGGVPGLIEKFNLSTGVSVYLHEQNIEGMSEMANAKNSAYFGVTSTIENKLLVFNKNENKLFKSIPLAQGPMGIVTYGSCFAVTTERDKHLHFYDISTQEKLAEWDFSSVAQYHAQPREMAINPADGALFVKSTYLCTQCSDTQSSVIRVNDSGSTAKKCGLLP